MIRDLLWLIALLIVAAVPTLHNATKPDEYFEWTEEPQTLECPQLYDEKMMREIRGGDRQDHVTDRSSPV